MIANKDTADRPAPQPTGAPAFVYSGTLTNSDTTAKQVIMGSRYTITSGGYLVGLRVNVITDQSYHLYFVLDPNGTPSFEDLGSFTATTDGWSSVTIQPKIVGTGVEFDIIAVVNKPADVPATWTGDWNYQTPNNPTTPTSGQVDHSNKDLDNLLFHKTDDNGTDRGAELLALSPGDVIDSGSVIYNINSVTDDGTYVTFSVMPGTQGPDGVTTFTFETVASVPITGGSDTGYYLGNANVSGLFIADGDYSDIIPDDNAYIVDIEVQAASVSADWDLVALMGGGSSSGGGDASIDWGFITGTLSDQTDLQTELDNKSPTTHSHLLDALTDVSAFEPSDGQRLSFNVTTGNWEPRNSVSGLGFVIFDYRMDLPATATPANGDISRDNNDSSLTTILYITELDDNDTDVDAYWGEIKQGDWFNIQRTNDSTRKENYDVTGPATKVSNVWEIPVSFYETTGTALSDNEKVKVLWRISEPEIIDNLTSTASNASLSANMGRELDVTKVTTNPALVTGSEAVGNMVILTRAEYDALGAGRPSTTIYYIDG